MKLRYLGDSYDIIKQSMLGWLSCFGRWQTHPMFTEEVSGADADAFAIFLGTPLVSLQVLTSRVDRSRYFDTFGHSGHLFLDPDTGVRLANPRRPSPGHIYGGELVAIVSARPTSLTLVFDQSFTRGSAERELNEKFAFLHRHQIAVVAYWSHAPFLLLSRDLVLLDRATEHVVSASRLPRWRLRHPEYRFSKLR